MTEPRIRFLIGGVQKGGTSALAAYLSRHPSIALPDRRASDGPPPPGWHPAWLKEAHVFDAPDYSAGWDVEVVDRRFARCFTAFGADGRLHGDATPATVFLPGVVDRVARYNPAMRWVLVLRDPVERAISHYYMERSRGAERLPLLAALLVERWRLRAGPRRAEVAWRQYSYQARSRYRAQLQALFARFPRAQVLVLANDDLAQQPAATVARVLRFLGLPDLPAGGQAWPRVFDGGYVPPSAWSPGRLWLDGVLAAERRAWRGLCTPAATDSGSGQG